MPKGYIQLGASCSSPSICPARATGCVVGPVPFLKMEFGIKVLFSIGFANIVSARDKIKVKWCRNILTDYLLYTVHSVN